GICRTFGFMKLRKAMPALINVLKRLPRTGGAAFALAEIGDPDGIPILLKVLKEDSGASKHEEITALAKLKCQEAVPLLIALLPNLSDRDSFIQTERVLSALLEIGDKRAIQPIETYLKEDHGERSLAIAKRVLVQLKSDDPVATLLSLL